MSFLHNENFAVYQLRTAYLANIKDGVGERLITVNTAVLDDPAFRTAGWVPNYADIKRTYSPPIPTAVTSDYFRAPQRTAISRTEDEDQAERGMITGTGSHVTVGPEPFRIRRKRREREEDDDSSDLSDESEDEDEAPRPAQSIKFSKMPVRRRTNSSPSRSLDPVEAVEEPEILVNPPSKPRTDDHGARRSSLGVSDATKTRARRDTTTSSEGSSENELDPSVFKKRQMNPRKAAQAGELLAQKIQEEREDQAAGDELEKAGEGSESDGESSSLSSFVGSVGSDFMLSRSGDPLSRPSNDLRSSPHTSSPKKTKQAPPLPSLTPLPPPRPISAIQPVSALSTAIRAKSSIPKNPVDRFAIFSGKGDSNPLYIKIHVPFSSGPKKPFELLLKRYTSDGTPVTVADAIGLSLFRYGEEGLLPKIEGNRLNVNMWTLRMIEDDEVDFDFPALGRTRPMVDFTSNNNRPVRGRARDKPWDEFALVEASKEQATENEKLTPAFSEEAKEAAIGREAANTSSTDTAPPPFPAPAELNTALAGPKPNPITEKNFIPFVRKDSSNLLDAPTTPTIHATPRTGASKILAIHFTNESTLTTRTMGIDTTTDTYIAEVFDQVCKRLNVDKALYVLKVTGSSTVAPLDRTVEALGPRGSLDLVRRRFIGEGGAFGLGGGSPGSSSPNAPLFITPGPGTPKRSGASKAQYKTIGPQGLAHPLALKQDLVARGGGDFHKRYHVIRKQPMSFTSSHARTLAFDGEYLHIMPGDPAAAGAGGVNTGKVAVVAPEPQGKTTTIHFSAVVGCKVSGKHPKSFRIVVWRERETKRYDFEAGSTRKAAEIVSEVQRGMRPFQGDHLP